MIGRLDRAVSEIEDLLLDRVQLTRLQPDRWQHGLTIFLGNAHDDVPAAKIVEVVRESAESVERVDRIPALFEFETLPLHGLAMQKIVDVDGQRHESPRFCPAKLNFDSSFL